MLLETALHEKFIEYLNENKIPFEHEVGIRNAVIDFKARFNDRIVGIEVKSDRGNLFTTIGQLFNAQRTFSDVYLLSSENFYKNVYHFLSDLGFAEQFGFIILKNGKFEILSRPRTKEYFFREKFYKPPKEAKLKTKNMLLDQEIINFLERHKNSPFIVADVANEMKISMPFAQKRVAHWKKFGLILPINDIGFPKPFRVVRVPSIEEEFIPLNKVQ